MTKRSVWCEFDKETRKYIKKRDNNKCVICGNTGALQIMHIFLSRSHGGKGCKENGCLGCVKCHRIIDNPIGSEQLARQKQFQRYCENYLIEKEKIEYNQEFINYLKFDKKAYLEEEFKKKQEKAKNMQEEIIKKEYTKKCKNCCMLVKNKYSNNTIPTYYCKYKKVLLNKSTKACNKYREV